MKSHKLLLTSLFTAVALSASAQGTAFTYQGQLQNNGSPASGTYDLTFALFNTNTSGVALAGPVTNDAVVVTNGLFTVLIDFGPGVFTGQINWLEIAVETNGVNTFTTLAPRQQLTPMPYAIYAESASGLSGTLSASQLTSIGNTNGINLYNFFVGPSGNSTMNGGINTANGYYALQNNTSGSANTANGSFALSANTSGSENTASGYLALFDNTGGSYNTAYGDLALLDNTSGNYNTANGGHSLAFNTSGSYNTAIGYYALHNNGGSYNIALGYEAGQNITTGSSNIDIGNPGVTGDNNIIRIGEGQSLTFIAGVITGNGAGLTGLDASQLTSIGNTNSGYNNFFVGPSGNSTTSGFGNTANGFSALQNNTSGNANMADGDGALNRNTSGQYNTASGYAALYGNMSGWYNTANGAAALGNNTEGYYNTASGFGALYSNISGWFNTAIGYSALNNNTNGNDNIALGYEAGINFTGSESNNIDIGNPGVTGDNNTIRIGTTNVQTRAFIAGISGATAASGVAVYVNTSGQLGTLTSSRRFKDDIRGMDQASDVLYALKPVTFKYKPGIDPQGIPQFGLVAEDVEKVAPDLVAHDDQGRIYTVRYQAVDAMLLNEFLKQHRTVEEQTAKLQELNQKVDSERADNAELKQRLEALEKMIRNQQSN